jgi:2'-5' RNA ligase
MKIRTFIALEIPEAAIEEIINLRKDKIGDGGNAKWEVKEKLHLTLKFLGDTERDNLNSYFEEIERITGELKQFELCFSEFGVFRKGGAPRILWIGLKENDRLKQFAESLDSILENFGYKKEERKFQAHITLLRFCGYENIEKILSLNEVKIPEIKFIANKVVFYESRLMHNGSVYKSLRDFYLKN